MYKQACVISHIGQSRQQQEDNFFLDGSYLLPEIQKQISLENMPQVTKAILQQKEIGLFAISDGMGGHQSGEVASYLAVKSLSLLEERLRHCDSKQMAIHMCQEYIDTINKQMVSVSAQDKALHNMGATLVMLLKYKDTEIIFNVGDSRVYFFDGKTLVQVTKDQTEGQRLLDLGLLTEEEVKRFPSRKHLSRYIGMPMKDCELRGACYEKAASKNGIYLLCSDGLSDVLEISTMEEIMCQHPSDITKCANALMEEALLKSKEIKHGDNITIMLVEGGRYEK